MRIMVGTPCYGGSLTVPFFHSVMEAEAYFRDDPDLDLVWHTRAGESLITRARNDIVQAFLESDCDRLLFIDADIEFTPIHVARLARSGYDVTVQGYPLKHLHAGRIRDYGRLDAGLTLCGGGIAQDERDADGFAPIYEAGTGFMMIARSVFEEMREHVTSYQPETGPDGVEQARTYGYFDTMISQDRFLSEDYAFCRRWQALGGQVMIDLDTPMLAHHGQHRFGA